MKPLLRRYSAFLAAAAAFLLFLLLLPGYRDKAVETIVFQTETMLLVIPPIFVLLGLLDVWVPREQWWICHDIERIIGSQPEEGKDLPVRSCFIMGNKSALQWVIGKKLPS